MRTIFGSMKYIENVLNSLNTPLVQTPKLVLRDFITFVEAGSFTNSDMEKEVCLNWRLSIQELMTLHNANNTKSRSLSVFGTHRSAVSKKLFALLETDCDEFESWFLKNDCGISDKLAWLYSICKASRVGNLDYTIENYLEGYDVDKEFTLSECTKELRVLKYFTRQGIEELVKGCNKDKLGYVYQRLRAPLFMYSSDAVNEGGKLTYERDLCLNGYKLEACNTYLSALNDIS